MSLSFGGGTETYSAFSREKACVSSPVQTSINKHFGVKSPVCSLVQKHTGKCIKKIWKKGFKACYCMMKNPTLVV